MSDSATRAKVLIVDDTPENLDILYAALSDRYAVVAARDGAKALELAQRAAAPDIILLDVMMPGIDGYEVCRRLKAEAATRDIPVIFLTALTDEQSELRGLSLGAVDYIHKPISIPLVQARVATQLELLAARRQLARQVRQLTEAAELRDRVEQIVRHDLKGPLMPVLWFAGAMSKEANLTAPQSERLATMHSCALQMLEMINRSLDLYKMEVGTYRLAPGEVELGALVQRVATDLVPLTSACGVSLTIEGGALTVYGEEMLCYSLFSNLTKNAIEASPHGASVAITLIPREGRGEVRIHNQGVVPASLRERFFDKFATAGKEGGTGLGTYSARLMAETMHGGIAMECSEKAGTTLTVWLPNGPQQSA